MRFSFFVVCACVGWLLTPAHSSLAQSLVKPAITLKPFTTDGCSMWMDGTPMNPYAWRHCCVTHDKYYWLGGTEAERKHADETLRACIIQSGSKAMAEYLFFSVRWGGAPLWLTPYRWGFGWSYLDAGRPRGYKVPSEVEQEEIKLRMPHAEQVIIADAIQHPAKTNTSSVH